MAEEANENAESERKKERAERKAALDKTSSLQTFWEEACCQVSETIRLL